MSLEEIFLEGTGMMKEYSRMTNENENLLSILKVNKSNITTRVNRATVKVNLKDSNDQMTNS